MNKIYDFYSSKKGLAYVRKKYLNKCGRYPHKEFKAKAYLEAVPSGLKPLSEWDDLVKIGIGTMEDCYHSWRSLL